MCWNTEKGMGKVNESSTLYTIHMASATIQAHSITTARPHEERGWWLEKMQGSESTWREQHIQPSAFRKMSAQPTLYICAFLKTFTPSNIS